MALVFLLGTIAGLEGPLWVLPAAVIIIIKVLGRLQDKKKAICLLMVFLFFLTAAVLCASRKDSLYLSQKTYIETKSQLTVSGRIYKKEFKNNRIRLFLNGVTDSGGNSLFRMLVFSDEDYEIGSLVMVSGSPMEIASPENDGEFDYGKYLKSKEIVASVKAAKIKLQALPRFGFSEFLFDLRQDILKFYEDNLPGEEGGLLAGICIGERNEIDEDVSDLFRKAGLSHILAISGLHLSIVGSLIYKLLRRLGVGFLGAGLLSGTVVMIYGLFTGNPISMIRALSMFFIMLMGNVIGRTEDMLNSLALVALSFLIYSPFIIYNAGFALSFLIILGICLVAKPVSDCYYRSCRDSFRGKHRADDEEFRFTISQKLLSALISGVGIWAFSVPVLSFYFNEIPVYIMFLNLLVLPVLGILLILGLISGLLFLPAGLMPCHYILYYYEMLADFFVSLPGSRIVVAKPGLFGIAGYYSLLLLVVYALVIVDEKSETGHAFAVIRRVSFPVYFVFSMILVMCFRAVSFPGGFYIDMLSVGQGDGIFVQSPENASFFIDGGSTSKKDLGKYTIIPYLKSRGVSRIDYWFLTHLDDDHINGFMEMLEGGYPIDNLILAKSVEKTDVYPKLLRLCRENDTEISFVTPGDTLYSGDLRIIVLYPDYPPKESGANENSLVFLISCGEFDGIFTGDMGIGEEKRLIESEYFKNIIKGRKIELLKVAHHGSKNSTSKEWLSAINPEVAVISAGKNNRYGHPAKETLERLREMGCSTYTTNYSGRIRVSFQKCLKIKSLKSGTEVILLPENDRIK